MHGRGGKTNPFRCLSKGQLVLARGSQLVNESPTADDDYPAIHERHPEGAPRVLVNALLYHLSGALLEHASTGIRREPAGVAYGGDVGELGRSQ